MEKYWISCKKNTANNNPNVRRTKHNRLMLVSNCAARGKKKSSFIKNQEAIGLILGPNSPLKIIPLLASIF